MARLIRYGRRGLMGDDTSSQPPCRSNVPTNGISCISYAAKRSRERSASRPAPCPPRAPAHVPHRAGRTSPRLRASPSSSLSTKIQSVTATVAIKDTRAANSHFRLPVHRGGSVGRIGGWSIPSAPRGSLWRCLACIGTAPNYSSHINGGSAHPGQCLAWQPTSRYLPR